MATAQTQQLMAVALPLRSSADHGVKQCGQRPGGQQTGRGELFSPRLATCSTFEPGVPVPSGVGGQFDVFVIVTWKVRAHLDSPCVLRKRRIDCFALDCQACCRTACCLRSLHCRSPDDTRIDFVGGGAGRRNWSGWPIAGVRSRGFSIFRQRCGPDIAYQTPARYAAQEHLGSSRRCARPAGTFCIFNCVPPEYG